MVTPNLAEAQVLAGAATSVKAELAERIHDLGAAAVIVTGGHGAPVDHFFDGAAHVEIPIARHDAGSTHGAGCTHSATLCAGLARGLSLEEAAHTAAEVASHAVGTDQPALGTVSLCSDNGLPYIRFPVILQHEICFATPKLTQIYLFAFFTQMNNCNKNHFLFRFGKPTVHKI